MTLPEALSHLTDRDRLLLRLREDGKTWKVTAAEAGISMNYAMVLYKKAKAEVERLMAEPEQTPPDPLPAPAEAIFEDTFVHPNIAKFKKAEELAKADRDNEQAREQAAQLAREEISPPPPRKFLYLANEADREEIQPASPRTMVVTGVPQRVAIVRGVPREEPIEMPQPLTAPWKKVELK